MTSRQLLLWGSVFGVMSLGAAISCRRAEIADVMHRPTLDVPAVTSLSAGSLDPFRFQELVCVPRFTHLNYEASRVDLLLYSETPPGGDVRVEKAVLLSASGSELASMSDARMASLSGPGNGAEPVGAVILMDRLTTQLLTGPSAARLLVTLARGEEKRLVTYELDTKVRRYAVQR